MLPPRATNRFVAFAKAMSWQFTIASNGPWSGLIRTARLRAHEGIKERPSRAFFCDGI
jgi:hypothetical protein